jgi:hypothetical protein
MSNSSNIKKLVEEIVKEIRAWPPLGVGSFHRTSNNEVDQEDPLPKEILTIAPEMPMPTEGHCGCGHMEKPRIKVRMKKVIEEVGEVFGGSYGLKATDIVNRFAPADGGSPQGRVSEGRGGPGKAEQKKKKIKESAQEYVWGVKNPQRVGNKFGGWVPIKVKKKSKK